MRVFPIVVSQELAPKSVHLANPVVQLLSSDIHDEIAVVNGAEQTTWHGILFQDHRLNSGLYEGMARRQSRSSRTQDQCMNRFNLHALDEKCATSSGEILAACNATLRFSRIRARKPG